MKLKFILICLLVFHFMQSSIAQELKHRVLRNYISQEMKLKEEALNPGIAGKRTLIDSFVVRYVKSGKDFKKGTIPIVIHLMSNKAFDLKSIINQIDSSNLDFDRPKEKQLFKHEADIRKGYDKLASKVELQFCLARTDGNNSKIDAITYKIGYKPNLDNLNDLKEKEKGGIDAIDPQNILNIWVVDLDPSTAGYAQMPGGESKYDGIVINSSFFGIDADTLNPYGKGKTLTHLIANYIGLYELWNENEYCKDDGVEDTPIHNAPNYYNTQYKHITTCPGNNVELTMNFMDNTDDDALTMFTTGQKMRLLSLLSEGGPRENLLNNKAKCSNSFDEDLSERQNKFATYSIYPNPNSGEFNISLEKFNSEKITISIYNSLGELVLTKPYLIFPFSKNVVSIDVQNLVGGIYNLVFEIDSQTVNERIMIIK